MKKILFSFLFFLVANTAFGEDGYVYGDNHCFYFSSPTGWVADPFSGKNQGLPFVFYPKDTSWAKATNVVYARVADKSETIRSVQDQVNQTISQFKTEYGSPNIKAEKSHSIVSTSGVRGDIFKFTGDKFGNSELVAYFQGKHTINFFVMTSRNYEALMNDQSALNELAKTYRESDDCKPCTEKKDGLASCGLGKANENT